MSSLRQKNQIFLEQQLSKFDKNTYDFLQDQASINVLSSLRDKQRGENSIAEWLDCPHRFLLYPQAFLSQDGADNISQLLKNESLLEPPSSVLSYRHNTSTDPHLMWNLLALRSLEEGIGMNPDNQSTILNYQPSTLISFGTGDGNFLNEIIATFKPLHLCVVIRSLEDLKSSFDNVDWCELWNQRCLDTRQKISLIPYKQLSELRSSLMAHSMVALEHSLLFVPASSCSSQYIDDRQALVGPEIAYSMDYLGFVVDEYNMLLNSVETLGKGPRIYQKPSSKIGGNYVVCGSGPSLDESLDYLKSLPNDWIIVACASNYRTLRAAGIEVDILCLLERGNYEYEQYLSVKNEFGLGATRLFASVTSDCRLHDLFEESMVYFRPALTPLSVFSNSLSQILFCEGPQTVNTGLAFCAAMQADNVLLLGVDLGAASLAKVRSTNAVGNSPRDFNLERKGNLVDIVYTSKYLDDGRLSMQDCIAYNPQMNVLNASNGVLIEGAVPFLLNKDLLPIVDRQINSKSLYAWWVQSSEVDSTTIYSKWLAARPRANVARVLNQIRHLMSSDLPWFISIQDKLNELLKLSGSPYEQLGPRIFRGVFLKLSISISRQCYIALNQDPSGAKQDALISNSKKLLIDLSNLLEREIYELFDYIENTFSSSHSSSSDD